MSKVRVAGVQETTLTGPALTELSAKTVVLPETVMVVLSLVLVVDWVNVLSLTAQVPLLVPVDCAVPPPPLKVNTCDKFVDDWKLPSVEKVMMF